MWFTPFSTQLTKFNNIVNNGLNCILHNNYSVNISSHERFKASSNVLFIEGNVNYHNTIIVIVHMLNYKYALNLEKGI